jgi:hypothetical protein
MIPVHPILGRCTERKSEFLFKTVLAKIGEIDLDLSKIFFQADFVTQTKSYIRLQKVFFSIVEVHCDDGLKKYNRCFMGPKYYCLKCANKQVQ